ncbi:HNH endonuclease [Burkholderia territorii]|uniref:HNH endonuclease n=1 Tax=Burkholderia territorii TaxID=1503055 RepID=UPI0009C17C6F|nr:HNH endonuclease [Burkholderia territorii]
MQSETTPKKAKRVCLPWTESDVKKLAQLYPNNHFASIAKLMNRSPKAIQNKARELGIEKAESFKNPLIAERWSDTDIQFLIDNFQTTSKATLAKKLGRSLSSIQNKGRKLKLSDPNDPRCLTRPIGHEKSTKNLVLVKVSESGPWVLKHHHIWKTYNGRYPSKDEVIVFIDGNHKNFAIENLRLMTRSEFHSTENSHYPPELKAVIRLHNQLMRKLNGKH